MMRGSVHLLLVPRCVGAGQTFGDIRAIDRVIVKDFAELSPANIEVAALWVRRYLFGSDNIVGLLFR